MATTVERSPRSGEKPEEATDLLGTIKQKLTYLVELDQIKGTLSDLLESRYETGERLIGLSPVENGELINSVENAQDSLRKTRRLAKRGFVAVVESLEGKRFTASGAFARDVSDMLAEPLMLSDANITVIEVKFLDSDEQGVLNPYLRVIVEGRGIVHEYESGISVQHLSALEIVSEK